MTESPDTEGMPTIESPRGQRMLVVRPFDAAVALFVVLALGVIIGLYASSASVDNATADFQRTREELAALRSAHAQLEERNWMLYGRLQALTPDGSPETEEATHGVEVQTYADGTYLVGEEIAPGTYAGSVTGESGYWARLNATTGMISSIIANDTPRTDFILTINPGDTAVELQGVTLTGPE